MGRHTHPEDLLDGDDATRAYFRPPVPAPVYHPLRTNTAVLDTVKPEPEEDRPEYVWVWPTSRDTVDSIGEAVWYLFLGFFGSYGAISFISVLHDKLS